jgi:formate-dependent nitrite reductase membrane component NrfD
MGNISGKYWKEWRIGVVIWLIGVAGAFAYLNTWPEKGNVNDFLMFMSAIVGVCAFIDPFLHPWLIRRGLRKA